jgi:hypothetical protein
MVLLCFGRCLGMKRKSESSASLWTNMTCCTGFILVHMPKKLSNGCIKMSALDKEREKGWILSFWFGHHVVVVVVVVVHFQRKKRCRTVSTARSDCKWERWYERASIHPTTCWFAFVMREEVWPSAMECIGGAQRASLSSVSFTRHTYCTSTSTGKRSKDLHQRSKRHLLTFRWHHVTVPSVRYPNNSHDNPAVRWSTAATP